MIAALILAAGQSKRMGRPKMPMPWGTTTVLGQVIRTFRLAAVEDILVVTGGERDAVEMITAAEHARAVFNPAYANEEMLTSLQVGLRAMRPDAEAVFVALGDQPQVEQSTVQLLLQVYADQHAALIVPSYEMHRGHPWIVARALWDSILAMQPPQTPRDFLHANGRVITYVAVNTPTILQDLDTPEDYLKSQG